VLLREMAKGKPTARLARELSLSCEQLHTLWRRIQANLHNTAPTEGMMGTVIEADDLYQHAGENKHALSCPH
jgi:hypothetical protein